MLFLYFFECTKQFGTNHILIYGPSFLTVVLFMYFGLQSLQDHHVLKVISFSTYFTQLSNFEVASICFSSDHAQTSDLEPCLILVVPSCCPSVMLGILQNQSSQGSGLAQHLVDCGVCLSASLGLKFI